MQSDEAQQLTITDAVQSDEAQQLTIADAVQSDEAQQLTITDAVQSDEAQQLTIADAVQSDEAQQLTIADEPEDQLKRKFEDDSSEEESKKTPAADSSDEDGPAEKKKKFIPVCTHTAIRSLTSALSHLGDDPGKSKLAKLLNANPDEQMEHTMQFVNNTACAGGWHLTKIRSLEEVASFDPLTACPDGSVLLMYLKQTDKTAAFIHSVAISNGFIFDTNHAPLPLNPESLTAINYAGIIQASVLTPKTKIAEAMLKRKRSKELESFPTAEEEANSTASETDADGDSRKRKRKSGSIKRTVKKIETAEGGYMAHTLCQLLPAFGVTVSEEEVGSILPSASSHFTSAEAFVQKHGLELARVTSRFMIKGGIELALLNAVGHFVIQVRITNDNNDKNPELQCVAYDGKTLCDKVIDDSHRASTENARKLIATIREGLQVRIINVYELRRTEKKQAEKATDDDPTLVASHEHLADL